MTGIALELPLKAGASNQFSGFSAASSIQSKNVRYRSAPWQVALSNDCKSARPYDIPAAISVIRGPAFRTHEVCKRLDRRAHTATATNPSLIKPPSAMWAVCCVQSVKKRRSSAAKSQRKTPLRSSTEAAQELQRRRHLMFRLSVLAFRSGVAFAVRCRGR
jgi:hypothetical protein